MVGFLPPNDPRVLGTVAAVERDLIDAGMPLEMANRDTLVAMVTLADDAAAVDRLVDALVASIERHRGEPTLIIGQYLDQLHELKPSGYAQSWPSRVCSASSRLPS